jgi:hypothetical protein
MRLLSSVETSGPLIAVTFPQEGKVVNQKWLPITLRADHGGKHNQVWLSLVSSISDLNRLLHVSPQI